MPHLWSLGGGPRVAWSNADQQISGALERCRLFMVVSNMCFTVLPMPFWDDLQATSNIHIFQLWYENLHFGSREHLQDSPIFEVIFGDKNQWFPNNPLEIIDSPVFGQKKNFLATLRKLISIKGCGPIMIRLSWHDAGVFNGTDGCPNAAMRLAGGGEHAFGANAGLPQVAIPLLQAISDKYVPRRRWWHW